MASSAAEQPLSLVFKHPTATVLVRTVFSSLINFDCIHLCSSHLAVTVSCASFVSVVVSPSRRLFPMREDVIELTDEEDDSLQANNRPPKRRRIDAQHPSSDPPPYEPFPTEPIAGPSGYHSLDDPPERLIAGSSQQTNRPINLINNASETRYEISSSSTLSPGGKATNTENPTSEDNVLSQVIEIVPDVLPEHALSLIKKCLPRSRDNVVEIVLHILFEDSNYPKAVQNKGKRKRDAIGNTSLTCNTGTSNVGEVDYSSRDRPRINSDLYAEMTTVLSFFRRGDKLLITTKQNQLHIDFPYVPKLYIKRVLMMQNDFYAPAHLYIRDQINQPVLPFALKKSRSKGVDKGKLFDPDFARERAWLVEKLKGERSTPDPQANDDEECENGIECGCCFSSYAFVNFIHD